MLCLGQEIQKLPFCTKSAPPHCLPVLLSLYFPSVLQEYLKPSLEHSTGGLHAEWVWGSVLSCFASCMQCGKASRARWAGSVQGMVSLGPCCPSGIRLEWVNRTSPGFTLRCSCLWASLVTSAVKQGFWVQRETQDWTSRQTKKARGCCDVGTHGRDSGFFWMLLK